MSRRPSIVVDVPEAFTSRFPHVFNPMEMPGGQADARFSLCLPAAGLPLELVEELGSSVYCRGWRSAVKQLEGGERFVGARSRQRPRVLPGDASAADVMEWRVLQHTCEAMSIPLEFLMLNRHLRVLVTPFEFDNQFAHGVALSLDMVQVVDLREGHIRDEINRMKAAFKEWQESQ